MSSRRRAGTHIIVGNDFRNSNFSITQVFAEGFDPDFVAQHFGTSCPVVPEFPRPLRGEGSLAEHVAAVLFARHCGMPYFVALVLVRMGHPEMAQQGGGG